MPLDALCLHAVAEELRCEVLETRIDKVTQPGKNQIILSLNKKGFRGKLCLVAGAGRGRIHLTQETYENPQSPPMFCMLLRKHLTGAKFIDLLQEPGERVLRLVFEAYNELGVKGKKELVLELMGADCNLILLDQEGYIIEAIRRREEDITQGRPILPGLLYRLPQRQEKHNPLVVDEETLKANFPQGLALEEGEKKIMGTLLGVSPLVARELVAQARTTGCLQDIVIDFCQDRKAGRAKPYVIYGEDGPVDFSYIPIAQYGDLYRLEEKESFSKLLEDFYKQRDQAVKYKVDAGDLDKKLSTMAGRLKRKIEAQEKELEGAKDRDIYRQYGDIITANFYKMGRGENSLKTQNFYDPEAAQIEIPLDPRKTPQENAAAYYKRYTKLKTAQKHLEMQMEKARDEMHYVNSVLESLKKVETRGDLDEIKEELMAQGLLKSGGKKSASKAVKAKPLVFTSSGGMLIYAGKNNVQNDKLTFKEAHRGDLWLHTQKIHGSHVIIKAAGQPVDDKSLEEAAMIAAWYSQGRQGENIPVDYALVKDVKKPSGGKPGAAHYVNYKTIFVTPKEERIKQLQKEN